MDAGTLDNPPPGAALGRRQVSRRVVTVLIVIALLAGAAAAYVILSPADRPLSSGSQFVAGTCSVYGNHRSSVSCVLSNVKEGDLIAVGYSGAHSFFGFGPGLGDSLNTTFKTLEPLSLEGSSYSELVSWGKTTVGGPDSVTIGGAANFPSLVVYDVRGYSGYLMSSIGVPLTSAGSEASVGSYTPPSGSFVVAFVLTGPSNTTASAGPGYTIGATNGHGLDSEYYQSGGTATMSPFNLNVSDYWAEISAAFV